MSDNTSNPTLKLSSILEADSNAAQLTTTVEFRDGMMFTIRHLPKSTLTTMVKAATVLRWNPTDKQRVNELDSTRLLNSFVKAVVVGWSGVTPRKVAKLVCLKKGISAEVLDAELEYSAEELGKLLQVVPNLFDFLTDSATNPELFQDLGEAEAISKN